MNKYILIYLLIINLIGFFVMLSDKSKAKSKKYRTRESTIFIIAIIGGSLGVYLGMHIFRHKTKHNKFIYGIAIILIIHILLISFLYYNYPQLLK